MHNIPSILFYLYFVFIFKIFKIIIIFLTKKSLNFLGSEMGTLY